MKDGMIFKKSMKKKSEQTALFFCEECGEKNFLSSVMAREVKGVAGYRCGACRYFNSVSPSKEE